MLGVNPAWMAVLRSQAGSKPMQGGKNGHAAKEDYDALYCKAPRIPRRLHPRNAEELVEQTGFGPNQHVQTLSRELDVDYLPGLRTRQNSE